MNRIFSPNMLKTFEECPQKYYFKYEQNLSVPQKMTIFEQGKKVHALAHYYLSGNDISKFEPLLNDKEKAFWDTLKGNEYFNKTYVNSEYNLSCKVNDFWIGGRLDALVKENEDYYILDYKTGLIPKNPDYDFQTIVYLLAADKYLKKYEFLSFVYVDLKQNKVHKIDLNENLKIEYEKRIIDICLKISEAKNYPKTNKCKYCEYSKFCCPNKNY